MLFFGGCAPYFDTFFKHHLGIHTTDILTDALKLMNFFDIFPAIMQNERCCGHDLLWSGDRENFLKLARLNVELISGYGDRRGGNGLPRVLPGICDAIIRQRASRPHSR